MRTLFSGRLVLAVFFVLLTFLLTACPPIPPSVGNVIPQREGKPRSADATPADGDADQETDDATEQADAKPADAQGARTASPTRTAPPTPFPTPTPGPTATATPTPLASADAELAAQRTDEAKTLFLQSDLAGAEAKAIEAIAAAPGYLPAYLQLTEVYLYWPHYWQQALQTAETAIALAPDDPIALAYLAWAQQGAHDFDNARATAERAAELGPDQSIVQQALADILSSVYEMDDAYEAAQEAVALDPQSAAAWSTRGSIASLLEYPDEAWDAYEKAVNLEPDFFAWHLLLARHEMEQTGDATAARETLQPALDLQPDHPFVLSFLVDLAIETNDWAAAEQHCLEMIAYSQPATPYPDAYSCMAGVKLLQEDNAGAAVFQTLAEAIAPPARRDVTVLRMRLLNDDDDCAGSRKLAEAWLEERPYSVVALRMIGVSYLCDEDFAKAAEYFRQALEKLPRSIADARLLANAYARDDKASEARAALNRVRSFAVENPLYYQALFEVHLFLGQTKDAIRAAQRWQVLRPESTDAMTSLALAELFDNNPGAAQSYALSALEAGATGSSLYAILGESYSRVGDYEKAEENLLHALAINPDHFLAHNFITQLYLITGRCDEAEPHIKWLKAEAVDNQESVSQYEEYLKICRERRSRATPDPATALDDEGALSAATSTLRMTGVRVRSVEFAENDSQRSLFVAFDSRLAKDSPEFADLERNVAIELSKLLPRITSQPDGLLILTGAQEEPQHIFFIATRAAISWVNGELTDAEFEETWLQESAEILNERV
jgi:tetratricopeptide (TPR) repeat protein